MSKCAVILLNWNGFQDTVECIESVLKHDPDWKIYVVDNASRKDEALRIREKFETIIILPQKENLGFCAGNNIGIKQAILDGASYVALLNNDTIITKPSLTLLLDAFIKLPDAGAISPVILESQGTNRIWYAEAKWNSSTAQFTLNAGDKNYDEVMKQDIWTSEFACGCCLVSSAEVFNKVGLLDERYFAYYDEAEWCKRLEKNGYRSYVTSKAIVYHKVSRTTPALVSTYLLARNRLLWMNENLSFNDRRKSRKYLNIEYIWHKLNLLGIVKGEFTKKHSAALIQGFRDFRRKKFGKWSETADKIFFSP